MAREERRVRTEGHSASFLSSNHPAIQPLVTRNRGEGVEELRVVWCDLAEDAVDAVRSRPAIAGGIVAALALFLAREPLMDAASKLASGAKTKRKARKAKAPKPPKAPKAPSATQKDTETIQ